MKKKLLIEKYQPPYVVYGNISFNMGLFDHENVDIKVFYTDGEGNIQEEITGREV
jgi:hypothetical protein